ncbi:MAG TPA: type II toxin-antitoxin system VapC family toxin [Terracidiphilus sp.]|nr:type II toxin-antitoxin system VapC family toxin [Terracidiphilus sp.]
MIVLDTNVVSEIMLPAPNQRVLRWVDQRPPQSIWITAVTLYEIRFGLQSMPAGKKQTALLALLERWLAELVQHRIADFDEAAARQAATLGAALKLKGRPRDPRDTMIAGIVLASHATLATRNIKHFDDIAKSVVNPWG